MRIFLFAVLLWVAAISIYTFLLCGIDKRAAKRERERVPEKRFFLFSLLGGALGLGLGMLVFHHKTRHFSFFLAVGIGLLLWGALLFILVAKCLL